MEILKDNFNIQYKYVCPHCLSIFKVTLNDFNLESTEISSGVFKEDENGKPLQKWQLIYSLFFKCKLCKKDKQIFELLLKETFCNPNLICYMHRTEEDAKKIISEIERVFKLHKIEE